jgi:hypothetical protein
MKDHMNNNHVCIQAIDSRRIEEIGTYFSGSPITPALPTAKNHQRYFKR